MGGFKFSYLNYVKDKTDNLLDEKGEFAQCSGQSIDNTVNQEENDMILYTIVTKPKWKGGKLMFQ